MIYALGIDPGPKNCAAAVAGSDGKPLITDESFDPGMLPPTLQIARVVIEWPVPLPGNRNKKINQEPVFATRGTAEVLRRELYAAGFEVYCIPAQKLRSFVIPAWHSGLKRWDVKKQKLVKWSCDSYLLWHLKRLGCACNKADGLNSTHTRDAFAAALCALGNPGLLKEWRYNGNG